MKSTLLTMGWMPLIFLRRTWCTLTLTDLVMPVMSGVGVISRLKLQSPGTPIIAMTGWRAHPSELATKAKADMILMKPFDLDDLDRSVSKLLLAK
jgi:DNA-binding NtrC family response regulator